MPSADLPVYPNQLPRLVSRGSVHIREDLLYTNPKGEESAGQRKRAERALDHIQEILSRLLGPQEAVFYIARAVAPLSAFEQISLGWQAYHLYGVVLVITNERLLRFGVQAKGWNDWTWRRTVQAVRWENVSEATCKGFLTRVLRLRYSNGRKEDYRVTTGGDAKKFRAILAAIAPSAPDLGGSAPAMVSLCPDCLAQLAPGVYQCPQCRLDFKTEKELLWRTILIPGGGYFFVGWKGFGILVGFAELFIIFQFVFWLLVAFGVVAPPEPSPGEARITAGGALIVVVIMALAYALETAIVYRHLRRFVREFVPVR